MKIFKSQKFKKLTEKRSIENQTFRDNANIYLKNYICTSSWSNEYKIFESEMMVRNWVESRMDKWVDLVDLSMKMSMAHELNFYSGLPRKIATAIRYYRGHGAMKINYLLRYGYSIFESREYDKNQIELMDYMFNKYLFDDCVIAYRWMTIEGFKRLLGNEDSNIRNGMKFTDKGFNSCSININYNHFESHYNNKGIVIIMMKLSHGMRAIETCALSCITKECEITLDSNTVYAIKEIIYDEGDNKIIIADICS